MTAPPLTDRYVEIDGLRLRYIEAGHGLAVLLLHGGSLGSSADVFRRTLPGLASAGLRAIAFDQPGFGLSDVPDDLSTAFRRDSIPRFIRALGLDRPALVAHSQAGGAAVRLALADPGTFSHPVILSTGSLLPPLPNSPANPAAVPREWQAGEAEPTLEETRRTLDDNVFHRELITPEELATRHRHGIGANYRAFVARQALESSGGEQKETSKPLWQRLPEIAVPLLMIFGRDDRAHAAERARVLAATYPALDLHIVADCKHMLPWDAADDFIRLAVPFLTGPRGAT